MDKETITAKIAEHQARVDLLVPSINAQQQELLQRQGAVLALRELLPPEPVAAVPDAAEPAA